MKSIHVTVERIGRTCWKARFATGPQATAEGSEPLAAIQRLLHVAGLEWLNTVRIEQVDRAARPGQLEFEIQVCDAHTEIVESARMHLGTPKPSPN